MQARFGARRKSIEFNKPLNKNATKIEAIDCDEPTRSNPVVIIIDNQKRIIIEIIGGFLKGPCVKSPANKPRHYLLFLVVCDPPMLWQPRQDYAYISMDLAQSRLIHRRVRTRL